MREIISAKTSVHSRGARRDKFKRTLTNLRNCVDGSDGCILKACHRCRLSRNVVVRQCMEIVRAR